MEIYWQYQREVKQLEKLNEANYILVSIPPINGSDQVIKFFSSYIKNKHENRNLKKIMKIKEDEIDNLRKNPLRDDNE